MSAAGSTNQPPWLPPVSPFHLVHVHPHTVDSIRGAHVVNGAMLPHGAGVQDGGRQFGV